MSALLLPRFWARSERAERERVIARVVLESGGVGVAVATVARATLAGDGKRLRGIPAVSRGVAGVSPGSDPVGALMRKQARDS